MRSNYNTCLLGSKVIFVPYRPEHVVTYHRWMKDDYLLQITGSEPLSLQEEIDMQKSWRDDEDKLTFIMLSVDKCTTTELPSEGGDHTKGSEIDVSDYIISNVASMIGDVNLFLSEEDSDNHCEEDGDNGIKNSEDGVVVRRQAELDIMIAVEDHRGKGIGREAVCMMMIYGAQTLGIRRFFVKIKEENTASRVLFEKSLNFEQCNYAECFQEYELEFKRNSAADIVEAMKEFIPLTL
mmetsp:Transcript_34906/g.41693  ORF Transcript_34906/g.41693 Transcript_34906/m.41693 type:complete len:238 (-) Transcript_34906:95-808(-)